MNPWNACRAHLLTVKISNHRTKMHRMMWFQSPVFNHTFWTHRWKGPLDFVHSPFNASVLHEHPWKVVTSLQWHNMLVTVNSFLFLSTNPLYLLQGHFKEMLSWFTLHIQEPGHPINQASLLWSPRLSLHLSGLWMRYYLCSPSSSSMNQPPKHTFFKSQA